jgi:hypothetical protein
VAIFVTDAPAKCTPRLCLLSKLDKPPIFQFFHTHSCADTSTTECKQMEEHSLLSTAVLSI